MPSVRAKPPNGLCFSGGGSRSYIGAMGVLRALTDLGLMGHIRYLGVQVVVDGLRRRTRISNPTNLLRIYRLARTARSKLPTANPRRLRQAMKFC